MLSKPQRKRVDAFKNELRNYRQYRDALQDQNETLDRLFYELSGVKGVRFDRLPAGSNYRLTEQRKLDLLEDIACVQNEADRLSKQLEMINAVLSEMEEEARDAMIEIYTCGRRYIDVAQKYHVSPSGLQKRIDREILKRYPYTRKK